MNLNINIKFMKKITSLFTLLLLCILFSSYISFKKNTNNDVSTVSVCRYFSLVVQFSGDRLFPDNNQIKQKCNQWEGHMWFNAGTSGQNVFKCKTCSARVSIQEKKPRGMTFCEEACRRKSKHLWYKLN